MGKATGILCQDPMLKNRMFMLKVYAMSEARQVAFLDFEALKTACIHLATVQEIRSSKCASHLVVTIHGANVGPDLGGVGGHGGMRSGPRSLGEESGPNLI